MVTCPIGDFCIQAVRALCPQSWDPGLSDHVHYLINMSVSQGMDFTVWQIPVWLQGLRYWDMTILH